MKFYLFDDCGFLLGTFATFTDAYEEMENSPWGSSDDMFITTNENPWAN